MRKNRIPASIKRVNDANGRDRFASREHTKHAASKRGYKHIHGLSRGQARH